MGAHGAGGAGVDGRVHGGAGYMVPYGYMGAYACMYMGVYHMGAYCVISGKCA